MYVGFLGKSKMKMEGRTGKKSEGACRCGKTDDTLA
jgi:hypothetical protein